MNLINVKINNMKNIIIIALLFLFSLQIGSAQKSETKSSYSHQAGFVVGTFFGFAPSYRYNINKDAIQIAFLPIYSEGELNYNLSLGYIKKLITAKKVDFSFLATVGIVQWDDFDQLFGMNIGTQVEIKLHKNITFELRSGYGAYFEGVQTEDKFTAYQPSFGLGLMYNFVE